MADIAVSDVTHLILNARTLGDSRKSNRVRLSFGDGALTYPAGGVPLSKAKMGLPVIVESMSVVDKGASGYNFMYDQSAEKLLMFRTDQVDDPEEEPAAVAVAAQIVEVEIVGW